MEFKIFKTAVAKQFDKMKNHGLFRAKIGRDEMWAAYLNAFPEGSNPIYRERTEHDCSCCRQFIGQVGNVVAIIDGQVESIWDCEVLGEPAFQAVSDALAALVKSRPIDCEFLSPMPIAGVDKNFEQLVEGVKTWEHFFINIPRDFTKPKDQIGPFLSESNSTHDIFLRSLKEITSDALDIVLELIDQQSLYRGEEQRFAVDAFRTLKTKFGQLGTEAEQDLFVWANLKGTPGSVSKIRNTAIGTLLTDLSESMDIEGAMKSFESKVAPMNYRRPTALITKGMIEQARKKVEELGLTSALERRHASIADVGVNDLLFVDRQIKKTINEDVFDELAAGAGMKGQKSYDQVQEIPIDKFLADTLPHISSMEVLFENRQAGNLMSLVAPIDPTAPGLFKWNNRFSWTYNGEVADSIKERVKKAGGVVEGDLCCRLAWFNTDDLDFHMVEPGGYEIFYGSKGPSPSGGRLDVDMNVEGETREPVENIFYRSKDRMREGIFQLMVHNFKKRETIDVGFEVEIDIMGAVYRFSFSQAMAHQKTINVADIKYSKKGGFEIIKSLPQSQSVREVWGLGTGKFHQVKALMLSPNHWNGHSVGNRHWFFILEGCRNEAPARGFYNEFLKEELNAHRKVFEVIGSKLRLPESQEQVSGLGFSSTKRDSLICRVRGSFTRTLKIIF